MVEILGLILKKCPDGVPFQRLEMCCDILDNQRQPVTKNVREAGKYPYYGAGGVQDYVSDYIFDGTYVLVGEDGSVITEDERPVVTWAEGKIWVNNHAHIISEKEGTSLRYLYYVLQTMRISNMIHGNIPKFTGKDFRGLKIPIPPLNVQREIVAILDKFTKLEAELEAELEDREKQYSFYREQLLTFGDDVPMVPLGEVCDTLQKEALSEKKVLDKGAYPVINAGRQYQGYYSQYNNTGNALTVSSHGEYAGCVNYHTSEFWAGALCHPYRSKSEETCLTKYVYYYLSIQHPLSLTPTRQSLINFV